MSNQDEKVFDVLSSTGIPGRRSVWHEDRPPLPRFTYRREAGGEFFADSGNYARIRRYRADLYLAEDDQDIVDAFEGALSQLGPFTEGEDIDVNTGHIRHEYHFNVR